LIILSDINESGIIEDSFVIKMVRLVEQFFKVNKIIVEMQDPSFAYMMGYSPKSNENAKLPFYYWPFFMDGKILLSSIFDSMISLTFEPFNHLSTFKKLVKSDYLKDYKQKRKS
jgi:hypothetical protein